MVGQPAARLVCLMQKLRNEQVCLLLSPSMRTSFDNSSLNLRHMSMPIDFITVCKQTLGSWHGLSACSAPPDCPKLHIVMLVLSGALNPVHAGHLGMLAKACQAMRLRRADERDTVVLGGALAPSSDAYVQGKLGPQALPLELRTRLCALAIDEYQLQEQQETLRVPAAAAARPCLVALPWGDASGSNTAKMLEEQLTHAFKTDATWSARATDWTFECLPIFGSDFLCRYRHVVRRPFVITAPMPTAVTPPRDASSRMLAKRVRCIPDLFSSTT